MDRTTTRMPLLLSILLINHHLLQIFCFHFEPHVEPHKVRKLFVAATKPLMDDDDYSSDHLQAAMSPTNHDLNDLLLPNFPIGDSKRQMTNGGGFDDGHLGQLFGQHYGNDPIRGPLVKHYPVYIHTYKTTNKNQKSAWDTIMAGLPSIFLTLLTTPMLITLLMNILKHIFVIQSVLTQQMFTPTNMNARETFDKLNQIQNDFNEAIKKFQQKPH